MMTYYHVKTDLFGIKAGSVERFAAHKAGALVMDGSIEPYEEKRHGSLPGSPALIAKQAAARAEDRRRAAEASQDAAKGRQKTK